MSPLSPALIAVSSLRPVATKALSLATLDRETPYPQPFPPKSGEREQHMCERRASAHSSSVQRERWLGLVSLSPDSADSGAREQLPGPRCRRGRMRRRRASASRSFRAHPPKVWLARRQRAEATPTESCLWQVLRRGGVDGWYFRRQHVIGGFVVDFYCAKLRLALEADGGVHLLREEYDRERDRALLRLGVQVVRFLNEDVLGDLDDVRRRIGRACALRAESFSLSPDSADSGERAGDRGFAGRRVRGL